MANVSRSAWPRWNATPRERTLVLLAASVGRPMLAQQRADSVRLPEPTLAAAQAVVDTSGRLYGSQLVPRALGASLGIVDSAMIAASAARTLSELLAARVAGVSVLQSSGTVGAGARVRLRGASSFVALREPIVVVDGIRVDARQDAPGLVGGGQQPSRLDDIDFDQVERIEILRGPAASAMYGTDGAGGVIRLTTRTPHRGAPTWSAWAEGGASADLTDYPTNYSTGSGITGEESCTRAEVTVGTCTPGPLLSWNPLESASPFRTAGRAALGGSVSGGPRWLAALVGGSARHEQGVLAPNDITHYAARVNLDAEVLSSLRLALRTSYVDSRLALPAGDGDMATKFVGGLTGNAVDDPVDRGYNTDRRLVPPDAPTNQRIRRAFGSLTATWEPVRWLTARGVAGGEGLRRDDVRSLGVMTNPPPNVPPVLQGSTGRDTRGTFGATATAAVHLTRSLASETSLGIEHLTLSTHSTDSIGSGGFRELLDVRSRSRVTGLLASERLSWRDRRYLGVGVRHDRWSLTRFAPHTFISADGAWVVSDEPFFPETRLLSSLRLRAAYGRSADFRTYASLTAPSTPPYPEAPVPSELPGETVSEFEVGADAFLAHRVWVEATWYRQHSGDAMTNGCCFGFPGAWTGAWHTTGLDAAISSFIISSPRVDWTARLDVSVLSNRVEDIVLGSRNVGPTLVPLVRFRNTNGYPIAGIWGNPLFGS